MDEFAFDGAAVFGFPDGAGAVGAYGVAGCVDEGGFGGLEDPLWAGGGLLAGVDLDAFAGDGEDWVLRGWRVGGDFGRLPAVARERVAARITERWVAACHWTKVYSCLDVHEFG